MQLTKTQIQRLSRLARLQLTDEEATQYSRDLTVILDYFDQLQALDTAWGVLQDSDNGVVNVLRDDVIRPSLSRGEALRSAPDREGGCIRVPKVIG